MLTLNNVLEQQQISLLQLFQMFDTDHSNSINQQEFLKMFNQMNLDIHPHQIIELFKDIDHSNNNSISYNELINYISNAQKHSLRI